MRNFRTKILFASSQLAESKSMDFSITEYNRRETGKKGRLKGIN